MENPSYKMEFQIQESQRSEITPKGHPYYSQKGTSPSSDLFSATIRYFDSKNRFVLKELKNKISTFENKLKRKQNKNKLYQKACKITPLYLEKINTRTKNDLVKFTFISMFFKYLAGDQGKIPWQEIEPLHPDDFISSQNLTIKDEKTGLENISKVAVLKLNGGLGTSMGCTGPKSAIKVDGNNSFLDIIIKQIFAQRKKYSADIPLILMNSFNTTTETRDIIGSKINYTEFLQNEFPKIDAKNNKPFSFPSDTNKEWNPPGHGDLYLSLLMSGQLDDLLSKGYRYLFISNADNLGPKLEPKSLGYMINNQIQFLIETTPKTKQDVKGGTIIRTGPHLNLLERVQVEEEHLSNFEDIQKFKIFNTNNIWLDLQALKDKFEKGLIELPIIVNPKKVDNFDVIQLEHAMGAAIGIFNRTATIIVDRNRFLPVKKTNDLLILQSDFILKEDDGTFIMNPKRRTKAYPEIILSSHYQTVSEYEKRFKHIPSLLECEKLVLDGDITLEQNVTFKGNVTVSSKNGSSLMLKNQIFENTNLK